MKLIAPVGVGRKPQSFHLGGDSDTNLAASLVLSTSSLAEGRW